MKHLRVSESLYNVAILRAMSELCLISQPTSGEQNVPEFLQAILASHTFEKAPALRNLLAYLWSNRHVPVSEYAIATEALGRTSTFDARIDATVRVQIGRLRQRLERFYEVEGKSLCERLSIPLGSHQVQVHHASARDSLAISPPALILPAIAAQQSKHSSAWWIYAWSLLTAALVILCAVQASQIRGSRPAPLADPPWFWQTFLQNKLPIRIVLPTPVFFSFRSGKDHAIMFRDTEINDYSDPPQSPSSGA